ncbi:MAG: hypothetical protein COA79_06160 [Planctomycetota bacterium]|nr:MAG: hypothetical protein COA79_06160 [Planctomycetota bacterium]
MTNPLKKTCLITGAGGYIGQHLTNRLAEENWDITGTINSSNHISTEQIHYLNIDLSNIDKIDLLLPELKKKRFDAIIHCAGYSPDLNILKITEIDLLKALNINYNALVRLNHLLENNINPHGQIIHFGSRVATQGNHGQIAYSVAKGLLIDYTKQLAAHLGNIPIKVNMIIPGVHPSKMLGEYAKTVKENAKKNSYLNQLTSIEDVLNCVLFLLQSKTISGQIFNIESRPS